MLSFASSVATSYVGQPWSLYRTLLENHYENKAIVLHENNETKVTAESMVYGMFFTLVSHDREHFDALLETVHTKLMQNKDSSKVLASVPKTSDEKVPSAKTSTLLFLAYDLLVASEHFHEESYKKEALGLLERVKVENTKESQVLGRVLLLDETSYTKEEFSIAPASLPPFVMQKISQYDNDYKALYHNTIQAVVRGSGDGYIADILTFNYESDLIVRADTVGSEEGATYYLWLGITSSADPNRKLLIPLYENMTFTTDYERVSPQLFYMYPHKNKGSGSLIYDACLMPLSTDKTRDYLRTRLKAHNFKEDEFLELITTMFATGYDERLYEFLKDGSLSSVYYKN